MSGALAFLGGSHRHTLGNKWLGDFDWLGALAETYLLWGVALTPSEFVIDTPAGLRSVDYQGPVTPGSIHFDWQMPGQNRFLNEPDWSATNVAVSEVDLPY